MFQIWVKPKVKQTDPEYKQLSFNDEEKRDLLKLIVSESGRNGSVPIKQDLDIYASLLSKDKELMFSMDKDKAWLQLIDGELQINSEIIKAGDGIKVSSKADLKIKAIEDSHFLLFSIS